MGLCYEKPTPTLETLEETPTPLPKTRLSKSRSPRKPRSRRNSHSSAQPVAGILQELPGELELPLYDPPHLQAAFPAPSLAKHIKSLLTRRHGSGKPNEALIPEGAEAEHYLGLDQSFRFLKHFFSKYELGKEVGRRHFGYKCAAKAKKGNMKGDEVAVKVIPKAKVGIH